VSTAGDVSAGTAVSRGTAESVDGIASGGTPESVDTAESGVDPESDDAGRIADWSREQAGVRRSQRAPIMNLATTRSTDTSQS